MASANSTIASSASPRQTISMPGTRITSSGTTVAYTGFASLTAVPLPTLSNSLVVSARTQEELGWTPVILPESRTRIKDRDQEAYFLPAARALKEKTNATIILVGGLKSFSKMEEVLISKGADFVSMSRPLIRQPDLPTLWRSGEGPDKAECISCNACLPIGTARLACRAKIQ
jgi:2,4-dienoyl-CoA reductase-like NADH-dependent reductase (Old Yellow Enzyme family)